MKVHEFFYRLEQQNTGADRVHWTDYGPAGLGSDPTRRFHLEAYEFYYDGSERRAEAFGATWDEAAEKLLEVLENPR